MSSEAQRLGEDIKDAIAELAEGRRFPDLMAAIDQLVQLAQQADGGTAGAARKACTNCDDTGDVTSIDGEWRGVCHCPAGDKFRTPPTAPQALTEGAIWLNSQDLEDLERLNDLFSDDCSYDLEPERMQHLAKLGVIRHHSRGFYSITAFGRHLIDPEWGLPLRTVEQINRDQDAAHGISAAGINKKGGA
jgi:hypothetical protein